MIDEHYLDTLFPPKRYVALTRREAVECGAGTYSEWECAADNGVLIDAESYVSFLRDAARWRRLVGALTNVLVVVGVLGSLTICVVVLALLAKVMA